MRSGAARTSTSARTPAIRICRVGRVQLGVTMFGMFRDATALNQDISGWDVGTVQVMSHMFRGATSFNQNLGAWDVTGVTNAVMMFSPCPPFQREL